MHGLTRSQRVMQHRCALLDSVSMLCNKGLGGDKPGDASTHNNNILQASFVLLDIPCEAFLCTRSAFESTVDAKSTVCDAAAIWASHRKRYAYAHLKAELCIVHEQVAAMASTSMICTQVGTVPDAAAGRSTVGAEIA